MKTSQEILDEIVKEIEFIDFAIKDCRVSTGQFITTRTAQVAILEKLKQFILSAPDKCEHEWVEVKNWVNLAQQCSKCGEIR